MKDTKRHFIVRYGYDQEQVIYIDETEIEKAVYSFITGDPTIFKNGAVNGKNIMSITDDWNKNFGLNRGSKLDYEDQKRIDSIINKYGGWFERIKDGVLEKMKNNQTHLIGKIKLLN